MKEVKLIGNNIYAKAEIEIEPDVKLCCKWINAAYDLVYRNYNSHTGFYETCICENKKRLSTINKYAKEYGVKFVA